MWALDLPDRGLARFGCVNLRQPTRRSFAIIRCED
jgi:hypothetical protein